jgi:membrane protein DedA with SNARE-associated domain
MNQQKRFYGALAIYAVLAVAVWLTMSDIPFPVAGFQISLRRLTLAVLAIFAVRTILHWRAEQIRDRQEQERVSS